MESTAAIADQEAIVRAVEAAGIGTWEIDLASELAIVRSERHDRLFGYAVPLPEWSLSKAAEQVIEEDRAAFLAAVEKARQTGVLTCAVRIRWPDNSIHGLEFRGGVITASGARSRLMAGTVTDVGEDLATLAQLRESEVRLRVAQSLSGVGVFEWDIPGGSVEWSAELRRIYGADPSVFCGTYDDWCAYVVREDRAIVEDRMRDAMAQRRRHVGIDLRVKRVDGAIRQVECVGSITYAADGTPIRCIGVVRDRTEEFRVARALRESEARYRAVFDQAAVGVGIVDVDLMGRWRRVNRRLAELLGYDEPEDLLGKSYLEMTHPDDRAVGTERVRALQEGRIAYYSHDKRFLRKDGSSLWVNVTASLVRDPETGKPSFRTSVVVDATERKRAEAARFEAEERLRFAQEAAGAGLWDLDVVRGIATCSERYCRLFGLDPEGAGHRTTEEWLAQVHPDDRARASAAVTEALTSGGYESEYRAVWPDGTVRWVTAFGRARYDASGRPTRFMGLVVDVTELRKIELRLRMASEGAGLATWEQDMPHGEAIWSANHFALFGYPVDPAGHASFAMWHDCVHPDDVYSVDTTMAACRDERRFEVVYRIRRADNGAERWMQSVGRGLEFDATGVPSRMIGVTLDVTDREVSRARLRELQAELIHYSRVTDAGMMASGLAHELAQPVTAAASALQGARLTLDRVAHVLPQDARDELDAALDLGTSQVARAGQIIRGLRDFILPQAASRRQPEALRSLAGDAISLASIGLGRSLASITNDVPDDLPEVLVNGVEIRQVLLNLLRNALQALQACPASQVSRNVWVSAAAREGMIEVTVGDNGPGLVPEVADRLFEPFVTSKPDGMGVGLSICRFIVESHGGRIRADTNDTGGMAYCFTLPLATASDRGLTEARRDAR